MEQQRWTSDMGFWQLVENGETIGRVWRRASGRWRWELRLPGAMPTRGEADLSTEAITEVEEARERACQELPLAERC